MALHPEQRISTPDIGSEFSGDIVGMPELCAPFILMRTKIRSAAPVPPGKRSIEVFTEYAEARMGGPLNVRMCIDEQAVGETTVGDTTVPVSAPLLFSANDCLDEHAGGSSGTDGFPACRR